MLFLHLKPCIKTMFTLLSASIEKTIAFQVYNLKVCFNNTNFNHIINVN